MSSVDPRIITLRGRQNIEQQALSAQFLALHPHLDIYEATPWSYEDNQAETAFFAQVEARWLREGAALQALIDAEHASAARR